jgi:hypothetical protein
MAEVNLLDELACVEKAGLENRSLPAAGLVSIELEE